MRDLLDMLPRTIIERVKREAERLGISLEEYLIELISQNLDPKDRAKEYIATAKEMLERVREELKRGNVRQAAEKLWGITALAIKAYAYWRENTRLSSHAQLWEYSRKLRMELGDWVHDAWMNATGMHVCFYEGWCSEEDVEEAIKRIVRLVEGVEKIMKT